MPDPFDDGFESFDEIWREGARPPIFKLVESDGNLHEFKSKIEDNPTIKKRIKGKFKGIVEQTKLKNPSLRAIKIIDKKTNKELLFYGLNDSIEQLRKDIRLNSIVQMIFYSPTNWRLRKV